MSKSKNRIAKNRNQLPPAEQFKELIPFGRVLVALGLVPGITID
jgi:hypothetical protein